MLAEKMRPSAADIEAQSAFELPDREMMALVTIIVTNVLTDISIPIEVKNNNIAVQVCAVVEVINVELLTVDALVCEIQQKQ